MAKSLVLFWYQKKSPDLAGLLVEFYTLFFTPLVKNRKSLYGIHKRKNSKIDMPKRSG
jgi:hypothetical protein